MNKCKHLQNSSYKTDKLETNLKKLLNFALLNYPCFGAFQYVNINVSAIGHPDWETVN